MKPDDLDRILSEQIGIEPSSGFVSGVMDAVRREASAPPPIAFPWLRAVPGLVAGALGFVAMLVVVVKSASQPMPSGPTPDRLFPGLAYALDITKMYGIDWMLLTTLASVACIAISLRLTTGRWRTL
jgi:hypothetical protein